MSEREPFGNTLVDHYRVQWRVIDPRTNREVDAGTADFETNRPHETHGADHANDLEHRGWYRHIHAILSNEIVTDAGRAAGLISDIQRCDWIANKARPWARRVFNIIRNASRRRA